VGLGPRRGQGPVVIIGAHYDTRRRADQDPQDTSLPVPGANDGASGVAVLLELARVLDKDKLTQQVWLAFFDAEDNGGLDGWDWIVGSSYMAQHLTITPEYVIIVDMIGDADQQIYREQNSDPVLSDKIWNLAAELGYSEQFINSVNHSMIDDHTPFIRQGITAVDLIDFDYPYWHTSSDTLDKISLLCLERVGRVLETLLEGQP
jgi:glutaminyl-peptide cyclotransferase